MQVVGHQLCPVCGDTTLVTVESSNISNVTEDCDYCGSDQARVTVWWPAADDLLALVFFDRERRRLNLADLTDDVMN